MQNLLNKFQVPDEDRLLRGEYSEVAKMWWDRRVLLEVSASDLEGTAADIHAEAVVTMNQIRKLALESTPCIRSLMVELSYGTVSEKHDEMLQCCFNYFQQYRAIIGEACEQFSPDLWEFYDLKFN